MTKVWFPFVSVTCMGKSLRFTLTVSWGRFSIRADRLAWLFRNLRRISSRQVSIRTFEAMSYACKHAVSIVYSIFTQNDENPVLNTASWH
jgi:hypothetical protein